MEMEITKCDLVAAADDQLKFYLTLGNKYIVSVSPYDYAELNVGDTILVDVETKTTFGKTTEKIIWE
jgi:hypothetical protein